METKDIIFTLRNKKGLSQDELAEKLLIARQAISRWENGETIPNNRYFEVAVKGVWCFNQYTFSGAKKAYLPMLRHAFRG